MKRILYIIAILIMISTLILAVPVSAERYRIGEKVNINGLEATIVDFHNGQPIYESIIYPNIYISSSDGYISSASSAVYATSRTAATGYLFAASNNLAVNNNFTSGINKYSLSKSYLYFETSPFSGFTITASTLNIYVYSIWDTDNESIQIQSGMPTYPHDPLVAGDFDLTNYAGDGGSKDITTFTTSAYNAITLNAGGLAMINTTGTTKFCLRTTGDINNITPTNWNGIAFDSYEKGTNTPYLSVTYTALAPVIISVAASSVATTSARLNSSITDDGGDPTCQIEFGYGTTSKLAANFNTYDTITSVTIPVSDYEEGENPYLDVTGLIDTTTYFFRVRITNEFGSVVSTDEQTFTTEASIDDMTTFVGYPDDDNIALSWGRAGGATNTLVRFRTDTYPTTTADGTEIYNDTGISYTHTGLTGGTTYYYSAWGESGGVYSTNEINLVMTTADSLSDDDLPAGSTPSGWFQEPDESFLVHLQPFYSVINGMADSWGMPRGNMWLLLTLLFIMVIGGGLYIIFSAPAFSLMVMALVMGGFVALHILPTFMIALAIFMAVGGWATRPTT